MARKIDLTEEKAKNSPQGGVLVGKRNGQTIIYDDGKVGGWFVGKTHKEGGIKGIDKTSGQPIEVQTGEVIITAPALADQTPREFQGKMMTNREILSKINHDAGGVAFAEDGMEVSNKILCKGGTYNYGGKMMSDKDIVDEINKCGCEHEDDKFNYGGKVKKHLSEGMSLEDIAKLHNVSIEDLDEQVKIGMKDESIHAGNYKDHFNIVKDHLVESPTFYTDEQKAQGEFADGGYVTYKDKYNKKYNYDKNTSHDLEQISKDTGVSMKGLQQIYNKGIGAYKTNPESVRPNVKSKEQWAMARVYSAVMGGSDARVDANELKMNKGGSLAKIKTIEYNENDFSQEIRFYNSVISKNNQNSKQAKEELDLIISRTPFKTWFIDLKKGENKFEFLGDEYEIFSVSKNIGDTYKTRSFFETLWGVKKVKENGSKYDLTDYGVFLNSANSKTKESLISGINSRFKDLILKKNTDLPLPTINIEYKNGGRVHRNSESLVRDAKSGNTPARDLNNYNDLLDVQADGKVGGDSGIDMDGAFVGVGDGNGGADATGGVGVFANGGTFTSNSQDKIVKGVEVTNYNLGGLKEIAYNPNELLNIFKNFHKKIGFIDTHFFVTPFNNSGNKFKELGVEIGGGDFQQIIPEKISEHKLFKYLKGKYGGLDWSNFTKKSSNYANGGSDAGFFKNGGDVKPYDANMEGDSANMVFDLGGNTGKPNVDKIVISNCSWAIMSLLDNEYYNYKDFLRDVREEFIKKNNEPQWLYIKVNNDRDYAYIKLNSTRNTNSNFNPLTGTPKDLFKQIQKAKSVLANNYDWSNFFNGINKPIINSISNNNTITDLNNTWININGDIELAKRVVKKAEELGWNDSNAINNKIDYNYFINNIWFSSDKYIGWDNNYGKEITEADLFGNVTQTVSSTSASPITDLSNTKIWIGDNPELSERIQKRAFELGWDWYNKIKTIRNTNAFALYFDNQKKITIDGLIGNKSKMYFDTSLKDEITEADLFGTGTSTPTSISVSPTIDLDNTKIWVKDNPVLAKKVRDLAVANGFNDKYPVANDDYSNVTSIYLIVNPDNGNKTIYLFTKETKAFFDKEDEKEIFESDIFGTGTQTPTSASTSPITDLSNTKIWIGDNNPDLSKKIQEKAFELGWIWRGNIRIFLNTYAQALYFNEDKTIDFGSYSDKIGFDNNTKNFKEITEADLFGTGTSTTTSTTNTFANDISDDNLKIIDDILNENKPIDLTNTKIWIGDNPDLSRRVQEKAFELGWDWYEKEKKVLNTDAYALYFIGSKIISWDGLISETLSRRHFDEFAGKEITEADLFGNETPISTTNQNVTNQPKNEYTADLDKLVVKDSDSLNKINTEKDRNDLEKFKKLLPAFQEIKFAVEKATILKEINRLHKKITYEGFIKPNEETSIKFELFTPQGLLEYYYNQSTQSPVAPLEPACELPTPNGEKSKLPLNAYLNVRTPQFKKWFGDWELAYETDNYINCSKMIDEETKEPKIFYHGVRKYVPNFGQFSNMGQGVVRPYGSFEPPSAFPASYFADNEDYAKFYGGDAPNMPKPSEDYEPFIYKVFLSVKNPIDLLPLGFESSYKDVLDYLLIAYGIKIQPSSNVLNIIRNDMKSKNPVWVYIRNDISLIETIKDYGYDALIQIGDIPTFDDNGEVIDDRSKFIKEEEYLTFYPMQVKSATVKKSFYFDFFNDIRFNKGGYVRI
jgi:hypothetical protein